MVDALLYEKPYLKKFESTVLEKVVENNVTKIVLENTLFSPKCEGKFSNKGFINNIEVIDVQEKNGKIYHSIAGNIEVGSKVKGIIDCEYDIVNKVSIELSNKHENVYASILSLKNEIKDLDKKNEELQNRLFDIKASNLENKSTQILFKDNLDTEKVKSLCIKLKDKVDRIAGVFSKENDLYKYMIMSDFEDVKNISKEFNEVCIKKSDENNLIPYEHVTSNKEKLENLLKKYE